MTTQTSEKLVQPFIDKAQEDDDPYLVVHFSRQQDELFGVHAGLDKMDAQIIIKQLVKSFDFDDFDFEVLKAELATT